MIEHKFKIGQVVEARSSMSVQTPPGPYEITRLLPQTGTSYQYRLKSLKSGLEWVVREEDIYHTSG